jgi:hypothetical protein
MKEYVVVPPSIASKPKDLAAWIERAHTYARSLPPKTGASKPAASKTAAKRTLATKPAARS